MIKRIFGNLWFWVVTAFVIIIVGWYCTIMIAKNYDYKPIPEGEKLERQAPTDPIKGS